MMRKAKIFILSCMMSMVSLSINAQNQGESYDWSKVINAIAMVESKGNPKAYNPNGDCVGLLQITKTLVKECNLILEKQKIKKRYTPNDRWDAEKSKEMFIIVQEWHNPEHNVEKAIKCWNCGGFYLKNNGWKNKSVGYYNKVMKYYKGS